MWKKNCTLIITIFFGSIALIPDVKAQFTDDIRIGGYVQTMPVWIKADLPLPLDNDSFLEYRIQNRLNVNAFLSPEWTFNWEMRTRFFGGDLVQDIPFYADAINTDNGFFDLSWMVVEQDRWLLHYIPDRLNIEWATSEWAVRIGRQRINWGINMMTNPNDLFNIYSFYDFDYPERPGTDAIRIQRFTGPFSRWEVAFSPARDFDQSVAALMYLMNTNGYDIQMIGGYYRNRLAVGGGWAGSIGLTGFKGEIMLFSDLSSRGNSGRDTNLIFALSADHMFGSGLFLIVEGLYNQTGGRENFLLLGEPLSADNPSFSRFQSTIQATYPFSPIMNGSLAIVGYPDEEAVFISPSMTISVWEDFDLNILTQLFLGSGESAFANAGNIIAGSLKWNF